MAAKQTATRFGRTLGCGHCPVGPCMLKNKKQDDIIARKISAGKTSQTERGVRPGQASLGDLQKGHNREIL